MAILIFLRRPLKAACIAVSLAMAYAASVSAVTVLPRGIPSNHWGLLKEYPAFLDADFPREVAERTEAVTGEGEALDAEESVTDDAVYQQEDGDDAADFNLAFQEDQLRESSLLGNSAARSSFSCTVSFPGGYAASPVVEVLGEGAKQTTATAIFVDEDARYWTHGFVNGVTIPSSFRFGPVGAGGDYADIHPPKGSGRHTYTVVVYEGSLDFGPLLSSLQGSPWSNRSRAVGSVEAIVDDFRRQNPGKPVEELCRCSVRVSYEDIAQQE